MKNSQRSFEPTVLGECVMLRPDRRLAWVAKKNLAAGRPSHRSVENGRAEAKSVGMCRKISRPLQEFLRR